MSLNSVARSILALGLDLDADASKKTSKLWRVYGQLLLREIQARHDRMPDAPDVEIYKLYEHYLSDSPEHMKRFQNFMAETGIFKHIISLDWLNTLSTVDYVEVTSLLRRIRDQENVFLSYRSRPTSLQQAKELDAKNQNEILPVWDVREDVPTNSATRLGLAIHSFIPKLQTVLLSVWLWFGFALILPLGFLAISALALPFLFIKGVRAWAARSKISLLARFDPSAMELAPRLARYETLYADMPGEAARMAKVAAKTNMLTKLVRPGWIDQITLADRVVVTALFRKLLGDTHVAAQAASPDMQHSLSALHSDDMPQLNLPSSYHKAEVKYFNRLVPAQKQGMTSKVNSQIKPSVSAKPLAAVVMNSEQSLQANGWFAAKTGMFSKIETAILGRNYQKALNFYSDPALVASISKDELAKFAAFYSYMGAAILPASPVGRALSDVPAIAPLFERTVSIKDKKMIAHDYMFPIANDYEGGRLHKLWQKAEKYMLADDELAVVGIIGDIVAEYGKFSQTQVNAKRIAFDTFLIVNLGEILEKAQYWVDWHEESPSVSLAFAHCAVLAKHYELTQMLFSVVHNNPKIKPVFKAMLEGTYLANGLHSLNTMLAQDGLETLGATAPLKGASRKRKTLCLVEGGANLDNLEALDGLSNLVVCAPIQPVDASRFPNTVKQVQIEDVITMYSQGDMDISAEVDRLTEIVVDKVTNELVGDEDGKEWADFVEIAHASIFFSVYREVMAVKAVEILLQKIDQYEKVVFVLSKGQSLNSFIAPVVKAMGAQNVFFSIKANRKSNQEQNILAVRNYAKRQSKVKAKAPDTNWRNGFADWVDMVENYHQQQVEDMPDSRYALHLLEHVNGYFDSYVNIIKVNLAYNDVELITGTGNTALNDYIEGNQVKRIQNRHTLTRVIPRTQPPNAQTWIPMLIASVDNCFDKVKSPLFPQHKSMILSVAKSSMSLRLAQILDLSAYFKARFSIRNPDNIFTGPNQHMASRAASIWGKKLGVPVYDFLILANTNHHRYRKPIADYVYLYDAWYRDIYEGFFEMKPEQIRVSGPLFDYGKRLTQRSTTPNKAGERQHIVFFSQSGNFDNNRMVLEDLCKAMSSRDDVFLTVKLHPHESPANVARYRDIAKALGVITNISVWHKDANSIDLVNHAHLVVQSYSNVGLDAFLLKKPVITVKYSADTIARVFLHEKGIGKEVKTRTALRKATKDFLDNPKTRLNMTKKAEAFAKKNEHFLRSGNAENMMREVMEDIAAKSPKVKLKISGKR